MQPAAPSSRDCCLTGRERPPMINNHMHLRATMRKPTKKCDDLIAGNRRRSSVFGIEIASTWRHQTPEASLPGQKNVRYGSFYLRLGVAGQTFALVCFLRWTQQAEFQHLELAALFTQDLNSGAFLSWNLAPAAWIISWLSRRSSGFLLC